MSSLRPKILASFHKHGVRCTAQRYAILDYLLRSPKHPTAEEIYKAINESDPRASLATVYKALHAMSRAGLIRKVHLGGNAVRFESNSGQHHHFVCEACGHMEDIDWVEAPQLRHGPDLGRRTLQSYELVMRGLCEDCTQSQA